MWFVQNFFIFCLATCNRNHLLLKQKSGHYSHLNFVQTLNLKIGRLEKELVKPEKNKESKHFIYVLSLLFNITGGKKNWILCLYVKEQKLLMKFSCLCISSVYLLSLIIVIIQEHHGEELATWCEPSWVVCIPQQSTLEDMTLTLPLIGKFCQVCWGKELPFLHRQLLKRINLSFALLLELWI